MGESMSIEFIAEIGMNSDGNFDLNYELIRQAKRSGADIAKFQVGWRGSKDEINYMDKERLEILKEWCEQFDYVPFEFWKRRWKFLCDRLHNFGDMEHQLKHRTYKRKEE